MHATIAIDLDAACVYVAHQPTYVVTSIWTPATDSEPFLGMCSDHESVHAALTFQLPSEIGYLSVSVHLSIFTLLWHKARAIVPAMVADFYLDSNTLN